MRRTFFYYGVEMKISRKQLRRLIETSVLKEDGYSNIMSIHGEGGRENGLLVPDGSNKDAILVHMSGTQYGMGTRKEGKGIGTEKKAMEAISKATGKDLSGKNYYIWRGLSQYWDSGMTELPATGRNGDPYLYMPSGIGSDGLVSKVTVVAGPNAKAIGRRINASALQSQKKPSNIETLGDWIVAGIKKIYDAIKGMWDKHAPEWMKKGLKTVKDAVVNAASEFYGWAENKVSSFVDSAMA